MTNDDALDVLMLLSAAFPNAYRNLNEKESNGVVSLWALQFADMPKEIVLMAVNKLISTKKPYGHETISIAEVNEKIKSIHWEAYDVVKNQERRKTMNDRKLKIYERIYELTEPYRYHKKEMCLEDMMNEQGNFLSITGE